MDETAVYTYIAQQNPYLAESVLTKYNYAVTGDIAPADLGNALNIIVSENGAPAFKDVMSIHPDKDVILELFGTPASCCVCTPLNMMGMPASANNDAMGHSKCGMFGKSKETMQYVLLGVGVIVALAVISK